LHFDTPKKGQKKDLYSALILAAHGIRVFEKSSAGERTINVCNTGLIRRHSVDAQFRLPFGKSSVNAKNNPISAAFLTPKKKKR